MELGDYYCMLAEALDTDELESYERYLLAGGDKKKWKWSSPDKAGTQPLNKGVDGVFDTMKKAAFDLFKISDLEQVKKSANAARPHRAKEFAEITGRPWILMNPDGVYFDRDANVLTPPFEDGTFIIKIDYHGNEI